MPVIYSSTSLHPEAEALLRPQADFVVASSLDAATQLREAGGADVVMVQLPPALFANAPKLKAAIRHGAGIDMIPYDEATHAGVLIANLPGVNAPTVAEHVFMVSLMYGSFGALTQPSAVTARGTPPGRLRMQIATYPARPSASLVTAILADALQISPVLVSAWTF